MSENERTPLDRWMDRLGEPLAVTMTARDLDLIEMALMIAEDVVRWRVTGEVSDYLRTRLDPDPEGVVEAEMEDVDRLLDMLREVHKRHTKSLRRSSREAQAYVQRLGKPDYD